MAISTGSAKNTTDTSHRRGGRRFRATDDSDQAIMAEINITPLTDIFLVLLIIFMVTSSVMSQMGINVNLPNSKQAAAATDSNGVIVTVTGEGELFVNSQKISLEQLREALTNALARSKDKTVILEGDRKAVLGQVVQIMDEAKKAGASKFAVATK